MTEHVKKSSRILAIDILRGITIAGMILVNNPGSWSHIFAPLHHADWNGMTPTDLVFPFFMFIMGVCIFISLSKFEFKCDRATVIKIIRRTILIYLVGVAIGWFSRFCYRWNEPLENAGLLDQIWYMVWSFDKMRISGVLARLAVCYGIASLVAITVRHRYISHIVVTLLAGYCILLLAGNGFVSGETNILSVVDRAVLTDAHMYHDQGVDPEGLLSTIPSIAHTLLGFLVGRLLFQKRIQDVVADVKTHLLVSKIVPLFVVGAVLTFSGFLLSYGCPINKKIWSPTFVLVTCGLASIVLALLVYFIDVKEHHRWCRFFEVFGVNPLFLYVLSDFFAIVFGAFSFKIGGEETTIIGLLYNDMLQPIFGDYGGSLAYSVLFVLLNWAIGYQLYKRRIYIKL
uniref:Heparan-alpha-glucosaminide N-acetyltransferase domain-containing protein n=1 Tax=Prevotella sp. GTC17262 TaxID=3236797 RepID=A0AB33JKF3_9BACT